MGQCSGLEEKLAFGTDTYIQRITVCVSDCGEGDNFCSRLQARERTRVAILDQVIATDLRVHYEQRGDGTARFQR